MKKNAPESVEKLLERFFREYGQEQKFRELKVFQLWNSAVGEEISKNAQPVSIHQGRLLVSVRNSLWLSELGFERQKLKRKLNRVLGKGTIKEIVFRIGTIPEEKSSEQIPAKNKFLNPELEQRLEELLKSIEDQELREAFKNWLLALSDSS